MVSEGEHFEPSVRSVSKTVIKAFGCYRSKIEVGGANSVAEMQSVNTDLMVFTQNSISRRGDLCRCSGGRSSDFSYVQIHFVYSVCIMMQYSIVRHFFKKS